MSKIDCSDNTTTGFGVDGGPPEVDFAYMFKFVNEYSEDIFAVCPDACPGLREVVMDVCSTLSPLMDDETMHGSSINIAVSYDGKMYDVCVSAMKLR